MSGLPRVSSSAPTPIEPAEPPADATVGTRRTRRPSRVFFMARMLAGPRSDFKLTSVPAVLSPDLELSDLDTRHWQNWWRLVIPPRVFTDPRWALAIVEGTPPRLVEVTIAG